MTKRLIVAVMLALALFALAACNNEPAAPEPTPGEATGLDGATILNEKCADVCHGLDRLEGQELDAVGWEQVIERMRANGADLTDDEVTALAEYLALQQ
jgi:cytochrome c5